MDSLALFAFLAFIIWLASQKSARASERRYELYRQMAEHPGAGADAVRELLDQEVRRREEEQRRGMNIAGLMTSGVGALMTAFLYYVAPDQPVWLIGLMPVLVGCILLVFALRAPTARGGAEH